MEENFIILLFLTFLQIEIMNCWEPEITLNMIIIAGEISRLHLAQSCEKRIWLLAYKLASVMKDKVASVYGT